MVQTGSRVSEKENEMRRKESKKQKKYQSMLEKVLSFNFFGLSFFSFPLIFCMFTPTIPQFFPTLGVSIEWLLVALLNATIGHKECHKYFDLYFCGFFLYAILR